MTNTFITILIIIAAVIVILNLLSPIFYPDEYLDSSYDVDYDKLYAEGYRGIIYDIDNTLVRHGEPADEKAIRLMKQLDEIGFKVTFLSNNKEKRVKSFRDLAAPKAFYIYKAGKPLKKGYLSAVDVMGCTMENTVFIGDQLFTDVWGAKNAGIRNILVKPINPKEEIQIVLKRRLEWIALFNYGFTHKSKEKPHERLKNS